MRAAKKNKLLISYTAQVNKKSTVNLTDVLEFRINLKIHIDSDKLHNLTMIINFIYSSNGTSF